MEGNKIELVVLKNFLNKHFVPNEALYLPYINYKAFGNIAFLPFCFNCIGDCDYVLLKQFNLFLDTSGSSLIELLGRLGTDKKGVLMFSGNSV